MKLKKSVGKRSQSLARKISFIWRDYCRGQWTIAETKFVCRSQWVVSITSCYFLPRYDYHIHWKHTDNPPVIITLRTLPFANIYGTCQLIAINNQHDKYKWMYKMDLGYEHPSQKPNILELPFHFLTLNIISMDTPPSMNLGPLSPLPLVQKFAITTITGN